VARILSYPQIKGSGELLASRCLLTFNNTSSPLLTGLGKNRLTRFFLFDSLVLFKKHPPP
jgi:hypothetical protein